MKVTSLASMAAAVIMGATLALPVAAQDASKDAKVDTHMQSAVDVVVQTGTMPKYEAQLELITRNSKNWLIRQNPSLEKEISAAVEKVAKTYEKDGAQLTIAVATVWASYFKEDELKAILAFFKTEAGQKLANYQPRVIGESVGAVQGFSEDLTVDIVKAAIEDLNKQGHKFK